jgi:hypothetical protein
VAKQGHGQIDILATIAGILRAHAASSLFGVGLICLWVASFIISLIPSKREVRFYLLTANISFFILILLVALTQQSIQGVRYFLFIEVFLISTNVLSLSWVATDELSNGSFYKPLRAIIFSFLMAWIAIDSMLLYKISSGRSESFRDCLGTNLSHKFN